MSKPALAFPDRMQAFALLFPAHVRDDVDKLLAAERDRAPASGRRLKIELLLDAAGQVYGADIDPPRIQSRAAKRA